jgi:hypothetical protein
MPDDYITSCGRPYARTSGRGFNTYAQQLRAGEIDEPTRPKPYVEPAISALGADVWVSSSDLCLANVIHDDGFARWFKLAVLSATKLSPKRKVLVDLYDARPAPEAPFCEVPSAEAIAAHRQRCRQQSRQIAAQVEKQNTLYGLDAIYGYLAAFRGEAPTSEAVADALAGKCAPLGIDRPQPIYRATPAPVPRAVAPRPRVQIELDNTTDEDEEITYLPARKLTRNSRGQFTKSTEVE